MASDLGSGNMSLSDPLMVKSTGACMRHQDHYNDQMTNENVERQRVGMCVMKLSGLTS